jgi:uncharacterized FAD-dependent dehydrogenase
MIRITNIKLSLDGGDLSAAVSKTLRIDRSKILAVETVRRSIDARRGEVNLIYTLDVKTSADEDRIVSRIKNATFAPEQKEWKIEPGSKKLNHRPVIVGSGPAGLFAALILSEYGYKPIVLERGKKVAERTRDVDTFFKDSKLDTESNICFGAGGAGTFSDGKLKTRISDPRCYHVLKALRDAGAPGSIMYDANPHIGTDILKVVVSNLTEKIELNGGEFIYSSKVEDIKIANNEVKSVICKEQMLDAQAVILAIGHSARDTYEMLERHNVAMESKPFAMGVRIEHPKEIIDRARYHEFAGHKKLGAASYNLSTQTPYGKVYSFCMCPGGVVVNSSSERDMLCVNGMSRYRRDAQNSNSAIVTQISPDDASDALSGIKLQRHYESAAFELGGSGYAVPAMRVSDFLQGGKAKNFEVMPSVKPAAVPCDITGALPEKVAHAIKAAITEMAKKLKGFDMGGAVLSAIESRTSSPVRILRNEDFCSVNVEGLYPAGEGAGYAGGIVSSAVDGLRAAQAIIEKYSPNDI